MTETTFQTFAMVAAGAVALAACGGDADDGAPCAELPADCAPLFAPEFDNVYRSVIEPSCAVPGGACHASAGGQGGLVFPDDDPDAAYRALLDGGYVIPGDGACSPLSRRIASDDLGFVMPPGAPLAVSAQCAIVRWIDGGASR